MQEGDIDSVAKISEEGFNEYYQFDYRKSAELMWINSQKKYVSIYVAEIEGETLGYVTLKQWLEGGWIDLIAVSQESKRLGIARKLVDHLTDEARGKGMRHLSCIIASDLSSVKSFWLSCGFKIVGIMEKKVSKNQDGLLLYRYIEEE